MENETELISLDANDIKRRIFTIRGKQVMLDSDLAELYGYELKNLNRQVKRNGRRFPEDFMFRLTQDELEQLRCQNVTTNPMSRSLPSETHQKIFFDGQIYDAFSLLTELVQKAEQEIILIDGYVDVSTLNVLAKKQKLTSYMTSYIMNLEDKDVSV